MQAAPESYAPSHSKRSVLIEVNIPYQQQVGKIIWQPGIYTSPPPSIEYQRQKLHLADCFYSGPVIQCSCLSDGNPLRVAAALAVSP